MKNHPVASGQGVQLTVAAPTQFKSGSNSIHIGFTNQRLGPRAGRATFGGWLVSTSCAACCARHCPSRADGYTLDWDSTRLLHVDGRQEGVAAGFTKRGRKPSLNPLLAVLAEARWVVQWWLRAGNSACGNNAAAFFLDLWEHWPRHIRRRGVRADAGFCRTALLALWERLQLSDVVLTLLLQWAGRLRERDPSIAARLRAADAVSALVLGDGSGVERGGADVQSEGAVVALLAVCDGGRVASSVRA